MIILGLTMELCTIYQCIPCYRPAPTIRLIRSLLRTNCKILLDIEDSIQDVQDPSLNVQFKARARKDLIEIITSFPGQTFEIRINSLASAEYEKDIQLLREYEEHFTAVFLPKVENRSALNEFCRVFDGKLRINPIIESKTGIESLDDILLSEYAQQINYIFFGNYDYHLDTGRYPIIEQCDDRYWDTVKPIIRAVEQNNISFGNSPYADLADEHGLLYAIYQLRQACQRPFAMMSLHKTQTNYLLSHAEEFPSMSPFSNASMRMADSIESFTNQKLKGRSFALQNQRIITPHEFLLLQKAAYG